MEQEKQRQNTRECFRVEYPPNNMPLFECSGREYEVVNISEKGGRFLAASLPAEPGEVITGRMNLHHGETVEVEGEVLRPMEDGFVVCFTIRPIPFKTIINEQRWLVKTYRHRYL